MSPICLQRKINWSYLKQSVLESYWYSGQSQYGLHMKRKMHWRWVRPHVLWNFDLLLLVSWEYSLQSLVHVSCFLVVIKAVKFFFSCNQVTDKWHAYIGYWYMYLFFEGGGIWLHVVWDCGIMICMMHDVSMVCSVFDVYIVTLIYESLNICILF
jgi:hypothetical protein